MENEKLSQAFIQKYDPLSDSFVVVENTTQPIAAESEKKRRFEPFSFFKSRSRDVNTQRNVYESNQPIPNPPQAPQKPQKPAQGYPNPPSPPMPTPPPPPVPPANSAVILSRDAFNKLRILASLYRTLANSDPQNAETYNALSSETLILQNTMLSIYQTLSGNNFVPEQNQTQPSFVGNVCSDLLTTQNFVQSIFDIILALQRNVNVANIDRQLTIISTTLLSQKSRLESLRAGCET